MADIAAWERLRADVDAMLDPMICRSPGGGLGPGSHCAACCMNTGYAVGSQEELELARLLARVRHYLAAHKPTEFFYLQDHGGA